MSTLSAEASQFYQEVPESGVVWCIKDQGGFPAPRGDDGKRAMPIWSSQSRALLIMKSVSAYEGFEPVAVTWFEF